MMLSLALVLLAQGVLAMQMQPPMSMPYQGGSQLMGAMSPAGIPPSSGMMPYGSQQMPPSGMYGSYPPPSSSGHRHHKKHRHHRGSSPYGPSPYGGSSPYGGPSPYGNPMMPLGSQPYDMSSPFGQTQMSPMGPTPFGQPFGQTAPFGMQPAQPGMPPFGQPHQHHQHQGQPQMLYVPPAPNQAPQPYTGPPLDPHILVTMNPMQMAAFGAFGNTCAGLNASHFSNAAANLMALTALNQNCFQHLTPNAFSGMNGDQIAALRWWELATPRQVAGIGISAIGRVPFQNLGRYKHMSAKDTMHPCAGLTFIQRQVLKMSQAYQAYNQRCTPIDDPYGMYSAAPASSRTSVFAVLMAALLAVLVL